MKLTFALEPFRAAFLTASSVAPKSSPKPILQNVLLSVDDKSTTLTATDLEVGIRVDVAIESADGQGTVLLPGQRTGAILRELADETVSIEAGPKGTTIRGSRAKFNLASIDAEDFPPLTLFNEKQHLEIPARVLCQQIKRTAFATDTESSRYALGGVLFEVSSDKLIAVATDGRRLAKVEGPAIFVGGEPRKETTIVVPARSLHLVERAFAADGDEPVKISARANDILFRGPTTTIYSRLVEGRFPRWRDVVPDAKSCQSIELTVGPTLSAVRQASIVASDESRGVDITFADGEMSLRAETSEKGESHIRLPVAYDGKSLTTTLDHRFVGDLLKVLDLEKTVTLQVRDADSPALFITDDGYLYVVMPLAREAGK